MCALLSQDGLYIANEVFTAAFMLEMIAKLFAMGPRYVRGQGAACQTMCVVCFSLVLPRIFAGAPTAPHPIRCTLYLCTHLVAYVGARCLLGACTTHG
jgi:hypothetical protein